MCLIHAKILNEITFEKTCYKVLQRSFWGYNSPYQGTEYEVGKTKRAEGDEDIIAGMYAYDEYKVAAGFIHTFKRLEDALSFIAERYRSDGWRMFVVAECTISNCRTYEGFFDGYQSYASKEIRVNRIIPREEALDVMRDSLRFRDVECGYYNYDFYDGEPK